MTQQTIVQEIFKERMRQDETGNSKYDSTHSPNDWIAIITRYLGMATNDTATTNEEQWRKQMIRVAAIALAALEAREMVSQKWRKLIDSCQEDANKYKEPILILEEGQMGLEYQSRIPYGVIASDANKWERDNAVYTVMPQGEK